MFDLERTLIGFFVNGFVLWVALIALSVRRWRKGPLTIPTPWPNYVGIGATLLAVNVGADAALLWRGHVLTDTWVTFLGLLIGIPIVLILALATRSWCRTVPRHFAMAAAYAAALGAGPVLIVALDGVSESTPQAYCVRLKGGERLEVVGGPYRLELAGVGPVTLVERRERPLESSDDAVAWTAEGLLGLRRVLAIERLADVAPDDRGDCFDARRLALTEPPTGRR